MKQYLKILFRSHLGYFLPSSKLSGKFFSGCILFLAFHSQAQFFFKKSNPEALYNEALQATAHHHYNSAVSLSKQALEAKPDFTDQQLLLAKLYLLTKQYNLSRKYIKQVLLKHPRYQDAYFIAISIEMTTGKYTEAECYVEEALHYFPGNKNLMLKKLSILDVQHKVHGGHTFATYLLNKYPHDTAVNKAYVEHYLLSGKYYRLLGNSRMARKCFDKVLQVDPHNQDAKEAEFAVTLHNGHYRNALDQVNDALAANPGSYKLLLRKVGILQELHQYADALHLLNHLHRRYPKDHKVQNLRVSLRLEAAAYYTNTNPYTLYEGIWEIDPANREALTKLIDLSKIRGNNKEALLWVNKGLKTDPANPRLLAHKMDILEDDKKYGAAAAIAELLYQQSPSRAITERLVSLRTAAGREYLLQQQYDLALSSFKSALDVSPADTFLLHLVTNTYLTKKDYTAAIGMLNKALSMYPINSNFLLKKTGALTDAGRLEEAILVANRLVYLYPRDTLYIAHLADLMLTSGRNFMHEERYDQAKQKFEQVLVIAPANKDALHYLINILSAIGKPDSALIYANKAIACYPNNRDFLLKKAAILQELQDFNNAAAIAATLMAQYPYTLKYKNVFLNSLMAAGSAYQRNQQYDSALIMFNQVLAINNKDSLALLYSINILNELQRYDSALSYISLGIKYYPDNETFLRKHATTLENKKDYATAQKVADALVKLNNSTSNIMYRDYLQAKTRKNEFRLYYLHSTYDYTNNPYSIATIAYHHYIHRGSYAIRLNYAGRKTVNGLQAEAELYYIIHSKLYTYGSLSYANKPIFPKFRVAYSIFKTFKKETEIELGGRYLNINGNISYSGVIAAGRPIDNFLVNIRAYLIRESPYTFTSFNLTTRYYINDQQDYIQVTAGLGTSPDDRSRLIEFSKLSGLLTHNIGAGFQKVIRYTTVLGLYTTWINHKINYTDYQHQYDINVVFQQKF